MSEIEWRSGLRSWLPVTVMTGGVVMGCRLRLQSWLPPHHHFFYLLSLCLQFALNLTPAKHIVAPLSSFLHLHRCGSGLQTGGVVMGFGSGLNPLFEEIHDVKEAALESAKELLRLGSEDFGFVCVDLGGLIVD
ncbi:hypothetical protein Hdeb2414_s0007g00253871 [Helianthus debilis subsp. tardiflorus]